ncbi:MAG: phosphoribosyl-ATP diphosphatase [Pseudomonadales bacterium]|nr:phosphoribosyl-ATP diphosphatase [Halioglobus sp.]MCP5121069.1 phosphoribosyl-ATP diphosphatase [Pseudomonadales bacterium]MCP5194511.1 phosphoribosyl-ATP diphosphatase [Pseudomonadales bacterium]
MSDVLEQLQATLRLRKAADPETSYVASLHQKGLNRILEKVGEEATEVILAAKDVQRGAGRAELVGEVADLWFHSMVMLSHLDVNISEVTDCLAARFGNSGIAEKAGRTGRSSSQTRAGE